MTPALSTRSSAMRASKEWRSTPDGVVAFAATGRPRARYWSVVYAGPSAGGVCGSDARADRVTTMRVACIVDVIDGSEAVAASSKQSIPPPRPATFVVPALPTLSIRPQRSMCVDLGEYLSTPHAPVRVDIRPRWRSPRTAHIVRTCRPTITPA